MLFDDVGAVFSDDVGTVLSKLTTSAPELLSLSIKVWLVISSIMAFLFQKESGIAITREQRRIDTSFFMMNHFLSQILLLKRFFYSEYIKRILRQHYPVILCQRLLFDETSHYGTTGGFKCIFYIQIRLSPKL